MAPRRLLKAEALHDATVVRLAPGAFDSRPAWAIVVVVSAASDVPATAAALGAADYLQKPVEFDHLLETVRQYC